LKQLEEENAKLKRLVADLSLDKIMLQDVLKKSGEALVAARHDPLLVCALRGDRAPSLCVLSGTEWKTDSQPECQ
jgi:hypothetical protein